MITIIGLGPGDIDRVPGAVLSLLEEFERTVIVRTEHHPAAAQLADRRAVVFCDDLYETCDTFEAVYEAICDRVLDVACGTGVVTREAVASVGDSGSVAGVDPMQGMLVVAERHAPAVEWKQGVAESLPFPDASFDAVVSQFGMMFFTDRKKAIEEMLRMLKPGGYLAIATWASLEESDAYREEVVLLDRVAGQAAGDAVRAPFVLGDTDKLLRLFEEAGADSISLTTHIGTGRFPSIRIMVDADLRGWLPVMGVLLDEQTIATILEEAESALAAYVLDNGEVVFKAPGNIVSARRLSIQSG